MELCSRIASSRPMISIQWCIVGDGASFSAASIGVGSGQIFISASNGLWAYHDVYLSSIFLRHLSHPSTLLILTTIN